MKKEEVLKRRNEKLKKLLQKVADFICVMLQHARNEKEFDFWMWQGLSLDYWCVERDIYLD